MSKIFSGIKCGNITVSDTIVLESGGTIANQNSHLTTNDGYTTTSGKRGGIVVNYLPTSTTASVSGTAFASTSTVQAASGGFAAGDFIQVSGASNINNNGIYEVTSYVDPTITIDTTPQEQFSKTAFVADSTVSGTVTKINVTVMQSNTSGDWQTGKGATISALSSSYAAFGDILSSGVSGGQIITGGTASGDDLTLRSTTNATKGNIIIDETTASTAYNTGALIISGGVGVGGAATGGADSYFGGDVRITETTASSSTSTGALVVSGGVGVGNNVYVGGTMNVTGNTTLDGNVTLGNATSDTITFTGRVASTINPTTDDTYDIGSSSLRFRDLYLGSKIDTTDPLRFTTSHLTFNDGYTTVSGIRGGLTVNYLPTGTSDTIADAAFASTSTVQTTGGSTFSAGDFIQISGANNPNNNGIYEVLTHTTGTPNVLTIDTTPQEAFSKTAFVTDSSTTGAIRKITLTVLQANTSGDWQIGKGSTISALSTDYSLIGDHGSLTGLTDDDHSIYALLAGRSGGQTLTGGTAASNNLTIRSTSNATKGSIVFDETTASTAFSSGALVVSGGIGVGGSATGGADSYFGGDVRITENTTSSSTSTGALVVTGGVGVGDNVYVGGTVNVTGTTQATSSTTGSLVVSGGVGIAKNTYFGGGVSFNKTTVSSASPLNLATTGTEVIVVITTAGAFTVNLPSAAGTGMEGRWYIFVNGSGSAITITPASGEYIDNLAADASITLPTIYSSTTLVSLGTVNSTNRWRII